MRGVERTNPQKRPWLAALRTRRTPTAGKTLTAVAIPVVTLGAIRFPVAWIGADAIGETDVWIAFAASNVVGATIAYAWYRQGTWRDADLTGPDVGVDDGAVEGPATND